MEVELFYSSCLYISLILKMWPLADHSLNSLLGMLVNQEFFAPDGLRPLNIPF